ncbi:hypothetical protein JZ751_004272 [Albula glossodonta]|uniref:PH domain-containing protein n=1 Tax=Albula glossodonta TaxID=121402 RepID=A0A8T2N709_9TELE|nr:hypothetical protein JZ751_004272 [Albula glossodonta]
MWQSKTSRITLDPVWDPLLPSVEAQRNMASTEISWPVPMRAIGAQNLLTMPGGVSQSGYLHKKGGSQFSLKKWPLRFIIIHKGCVYYFKSSTSPSPQGAFSLMGYNRVMRAAEETTSSNVFPFKIVHFSKKHRTCDSDSDAESFYGSIERPLDITYAPDIPEEDYVLEDDEEEEPNYLKPDGSQNSADQPTVPPPTYPPPPVPQQPSKSQVRYDGVPKGTPPPVPPAPTKSLPEPHPKKPPPPLPPNKQLEISKGGIREPPNKGPPPPLPFAPHLPKPIIEKAAPLHKNLPPPVPQTVNIKMGSLGKMATSTMPSCGSRSAPLLPPGPATLPAPKKPALGLAVRHSPPLISNHHTKPQEDPEPSLPRPPPYRPMPGPKPTVPTVPKPKPSSLQRSSPDGQSFRSLLDEKPAHFQKKSPCADNDSDDDYENVQLPDSVFVDTTDTGIVERLFKETAKSPQDGLYCIRNSMTKTSKVLVVWDVSLNKARNYRLFEEESRIYLEAEMTFPSLAVLVEYYYSHPLPNHGSLCLQKPYGYTAPR